MITLGYEYPQKLFYITPDLTGREVWCLLPRGKTSCFYKSLTQSRPFSVTNTPGNHMAHHVGGAEQGFLPASQTLFLSVLHSSWTAVYKKTDTQKISKEWGMWLTIISLSIRVRDLMCVLRVSVVKLQNLLFFLSPLMSTDGHNSCAWETGSPSATTCGSSI